MTSRGKPKAALVSMADYERLRRDQANDRLAHWQAWMAESDKLTAEILARREGQPLDVDALWQAARADLEARDEQIPAHKTKVQRKIYATFTPFLKNSLYNSDVQCNHCKRELRDLVFNGNTCELENIKKKGGEIMKRLYSSGKRSAEEGQGLVEYALVLVLVAVIVIAILLILGSTVGNVFSEVARELERAGVIHDGDEGNDVVVITRADYDSGEHKLHLDATSDGDYDPAVTLTASPGGVMEAKSDHYCLKYTFTGCPCTVTVTSSKGGSASVTFGP